MSFPNLAVYNFHCIVKQNPESDLQCLGLHTTEFCYQGPSARMLIWVDLILLKDKFKTPLSCLISSTPSLTLAPAPTTQPILGSAHRHRRFSKYHNRVAYKLIRNLEVLWSLFKRPTTIPNYIFKGSLSPVSWELPRGRFGAVLQMHHKSGTASALWMRWVDLPKSQTFEGLENNRIYVSIPWTINSSVGYKIV